MQHLLTACIPFSTFHILFTPDSRNVATYSSGCTSTWRIGICRRRHGIWRKFCRYTRCCSCGTAWW